MKNFSIKQTFVKSMPLYQWQLLLPTHKIMKMILQISLAELDDHIFDDLFDTDIYQLSNDSGQFSGDSEMHFPRGPLDYESQLSGSNDEVYQGRATMFDEDAVDLLNDPEFIPHESILGEQVDEDNGERDQDGGGDGDEV